MKNYRLFFASYDHRTVMTLPLGFRVKTGVDYILVLNSTVETVLRSQDDLRVFCMVSKKLYGLIALL